MGGIVVDEHFETGVEGLFVAGECTLGPFGAKRIFSAITEMLVYGAAAGRNAGEYASKTKVPQPNTKTFRSLQEMAERPLMRKQGFKPAQVRRRVQEMAYKHFSPIRSQEELTAFIVFSENIKRDELSNLATTSKSRIYNKEWIDALELGNIVHLLEAATRGALFRIESRGVHYRKDCPTRTMTTGFRRAS
jgi:fumarate reductase flavoprotein subunit